MGLIETPLSDSMRVRVSLNPKKALASKYYLIQWGPNLVTVLDHNSTNKNTEDHHHHHHFHHSHQHHHRYFILNLVACVPPDLMAKAWLSSEASNKWAVGYLGYICISLSITRPSNQSYSHCFIYILTQRKRLHAAVLSGSTIIPNYSSGVCVHVADIQSRGERCLCMFVLAKVIFSFVWGSSWFVDHLGPSSGNA
eukprot:2860810-Amphidinium_carterae.1